MIGDNIRRLRKAKGYTQEKLSEVSGVAQRQISRYERGRSSPRLNIAKKLSIALGVGLDELNKEN